MRHATILILLLVWAAPATVHAQASRRAAHAAADTTLFGAVLRHIVEGSGGKAVRVDPRPLHPDPAIVELRRSVADAVPGRVTTRDDPLAAATRRAVSRRSREIARLGLRETDVYGYPNCTGVLWSAPVLNRAEPRARSDCPAEEFAAVILAIPRSGGAYWPGNVDQRREAPAGAWTVRVIGRELGPSGASSTADDYVAQRLGAGGWRIIKVVSLLIVE